MTLKSYAQNFEDVILWRALGHVKDGFYIDVGAQDPLVDSVSKAFYLAGWRGLHIEPTPYYAERLRQDRPDERVMQAAVLDRSGATIFYEIRDSGLSTVDSNIAEQHRNRGYKVTEMLVTCTTLADVFEAVGAREIHWLKIDVEGSERAVLTGWANSPMRPWVVVVESLRPATQSASHENWETQLLKRGYRHLYFDGVNRFYVAEEREELMSAFRTGPNVFDDFAFSGLATSPFCSLLNREIAELRSQVSQDQRLRTQEIAKEASLRATLKTLHDDCARSLASARQLAKEEVDMHRANLTQLQSLHAQREREWREETRATTEKHIKSERFAFERERALLTDIGQIREKANAVLLALSISERATRAGSLISDHKIAFACADSAVAKMVSAEEKARSTARDLFRTINEGVYGLESGGVDDLSIRLISKIDELFYTNVANAVDRTRGQSSRQIATVAELLALHGREFVFSAYRKLLGRDPDTDGMVFYMERVLSGISKERIVSELALSDEAKRSRTNLSGIGRIVFPYKLSSIPMLGVISAAILAISRESRHQTLRRSIEELAIEERAQRESKRVYLKSKFSDITRASSETDQQSNPESASFQTGLNDLGASLEKLAYLADEVFRLRDVHSNQMEITKAVLVAIGGKQELKIDAAQDLHLSPGDENLAARLTSVLPREGQSFFSDLTRNLHELPREPA